MHWWEIATAYLYIIVWSKNTNCVSVCGVLPHLACSWKDVNIGRGQLLKITQGYTCKMARKVSSHVFGKKGVQSCVI